MSLGRDIRGAVFVEHLIAMMPVLTFAMCIFQEASLFEAQLLTEHAALAAARTASVVVPDAPARYGGEPANTLGPNRKQAVRLAAIHALAPLVQNEEITTVDIDTGANSSVGPRAPITIKVEATFACKLPLAALLVCEASGTRVLSAAATMPNEGARYAYAE
jgi:hypothetical protein